MKKGNQGRSRHRQLRHNGCESGQSAPRKGDTHGGDPPAAYRTRRRQGENDGGNEGSGGVGGGTAGINGQSADESADGGVGDPTGVGVQMGLIPQTTGGDQGQSEGKDHAYVKGQTPHIPHSAGDGKENGENTRIPCGRDA